MNRQGKKCQICEGTGWREFACGDADGCAECPYGPKCDGTSERTYLWCCWCGGAGHIGGIDWCDATCNIVVGCSNNCPYCRAKQLAKRVANVTKCPLCADGTPHFHFDRLVKMIDQLKKRKKPTTVFLNFMGDFFDPALDKDCWVLGLDGRVHHNPPQTDARLWRQLALGEDDSLGTCLWDLERHTFIILTKFPENAKDYDFPDNVWLGTSITGTKADHGPEMARLWALADSEAQHKIVSLEPILGPDWNSPMDVLETGIVELSPELVIVGAQTGPRAVKPKCQWVENAIEVCAEAGPPIFIKDNIFKALPELRKEYWRPEYRQLPWKGGRDEVS